MPAKKDITQEQKQAAIHYFLTENGPLDPVAKELNISRIVLNRKLREWIATEVYNQRKFERASARTSRENNGRYGKPASPETKAKISKANQGRFVGFKHKKRSEETRMRLSVAQAKNAAIKGSNWKHLKKGYYTDKLGSIHHYDSGWELIRFKELDSTHLNWSKSHGIIIPYTDPEGNPRNYYPDLLITDLSTNHTWIEEIKGHETELDRAKYKAATEFAKDLGIEYKVLGSQYFRGKKH